MRRRNSPFGNDRIYFRTFGSLPVKGRKRGTKWGSEEIARREPGRVPTALHSDTEAHDRDQHRTFCPILEPLGDEVPQFMHVNCVVSMTTSAACGSLHQRASVQQAPGRRNSSRGCGAASRCNASEGILVASMKQA